MTQRCLRHVRVLTSLLGFLLLVAGCGQASPVPAASPATAPARSSAPASARVSVPSSSSASSQPTAPPVTSSATTTTAPTTTVQPNRHCGHTLDVPQVRRAIAGLKPFKPAGMRGKPWRWSPATATGTYDPCRTLSAVMVTVDAATGSSPYQTLLFHDGTYLGTATAQPYGFVTIDENRTTDDTIVLRYDVRESCYGCAPSRIVYVKYHWTGTKVQMIGTPPAAMEAH